MKLQTVYNHLTGGFIVVDKSNYEIWRLVCEGFHTRESADEYIKILLEQKGVNNEL